MIYCLTTAIGVPQYFTKYIRFTKNINFKHIYGHTSILKKYHPIQKCEKKSHPI